MIRGAGKYQNEKVTAYNPYDFNKIKSFAARLNTLNYYLVESKFLNYDFFVFETPNGKFISKATRGEKYTLAEPIEESLFWKINEKSIFSPVF